MGTNNNVNNTQETIDVTYQGIIYIITKEEYENLKDGWTTMKEMFG